MPILSVRAGLLTMTVGLVSVFALATQTRPNRTPQGEIKAIEISPLWKRIKTTAVERAAILTELLKKQELEESDTEFHLEIILSMILKRIDKTNLSPEDINHLEEWIQTKEARQVTLRRAIEHRKKKDLKLLRNQ